MGHRVLLVDDEADFLSVMRVRLSAAGYDVICAHHGKDAMEKLRIKPPDIIVSDVMMPVMDGIDFFNALKKNKAAGGVPVIMMSFKDHLAAGLRVVGASDFLAKPFNAEDLIKKIQQCLEGAGETA